MNKHGHFITPFNLLFSKYFRRPLERSETTSSTTAHRTITSSQANWSICWTMWSMRNSTRFAKIIPWMVSPLNDLQIEIVSNKPQNLYYSRSQSPFGGIPETLFPTQVWRRASASRSTAKVCQLVGSKFHDNTSTTRRRQWLILRQWQRRRYGHEWWWRWSTRTGRFKSTQSTESTHNRWRRLDHNSITAPTIIIQY